jgi:erythromycin esterase-like protein
MAKSPSTVIAEAAESLPELGDDGFAAAFERYADRRVVLLGECSHGTSEFYRARAAITRRLIEKHGFTLVAVEADWPDAGAVNRFVRHRAPRSKSDAVFQRFPTWMWRNVEVAALIDWMRDFNQDRPAPAQAGFYGLDMYNLSASIASVLDYLGAVDPQAAALAKLRYGCLAPWQEDPAVYGRAVLTAGYRSCEEAVVKQCRELLQNRLEYAREDGEQFLDAAQNARLVAAAERYYRVMYYGDAESWNLRDTHMFETLENLLKAHGPQAKAVVWAHNSHIGDARFTDMGRRRGELNLGQLCRERFGAQAALIGFGTHAGTVAAAHDWGGDLQVMTVRPSLPDSVERLCHDAGIASFLLDLRAEPVREALVDWRLERFIGVIYRPDTERLSHYAGVSLPGQFDAYAWFDESSAVTPLGPQHTRPGAPETYPFGL